MNLVLCSSSIFSFLAVTIISCYMVCQPSNILIDTNLLAKLSDFGLSKVMDLGQSYVSSEVRGTLGYIDPEYRRNHHVKASGDVYSFGIVLLQLLSGHRAINFNFQTPMSLNKMVSIFDAIVRNIVNR